MTERGIISKILFAIYLIFGLYLLNLFFKIVSIPEIISNLNNFIFLIAGILVILGGFNHLRLRR